jgi:deferrochelatase/peroxidase EfeB
MSIRPLRPRSLARDAMNEYVKHVGSAIFAVLPGVRVGQSIGDGLFA